MKRYLLSFSAAVFLFLISAGGLAVTALAEMENIQADLYVLPASCATASNTISSDDITEDDDMVFEADEELIRLPTATISQAEIPVIRTELPSGTELLLVNQEEGIQAQLDTDPSLTLAVAYTEDGRVRNPFPVIYDTEEFDRTDNGLVFLRGTVIPPNGYSIDEEAAAVTLPIFLYNPDSEIKLPVSGYAHEVNPILTVYNTNHSIEDLLYGLNRSNMITYRVAETYACTLPADWDVSEVRMENPGTYPVYEVPRLPDGLVLPKDISLRSTPVIIQEPGSFTLSAPMWHHSNLLTIWQEDLTPDENLLKLWAAVENGPWAADESGIYLGTLQPGKLRLNCSNLASKTNYYFQVEYSGRLSNVIRVCLENGDFLYADMGGDRDSVDRTPQTPPEVIQPPPDHEPSPDVTPPPPDYEPSLGVTPPMPDYEPSPGVTPPSVEGSHSESVTSSPYTEQELKISGTAPSATVAEPVKVNPNNPVMEEDTEDISVWSSVRLFEYLRINPGKPVVFEKHGVRLSLPADTARKLANAGCRLSVVIKTPDNTSVDIALLLDGELLSEFPSVMITMPSPFSLKETALQVTGPDELPVEPLIIDTEKAVVSFPAMSKGTYTIHKTGPETEIIKKLPEDRTKDSASHPTAVAMIVIGMALLSACFLYRSINKNHPGKK